MEDYSLIDKNYFEYSTEEDKLVEIENRFSKRKPLKYLESSAFIIQGYLSGEEKAKLEFIVRNEEEFNKIVT